MNYNCVVTCWQFHSPLQHDVPADCPARSEPHGHLCEACRLDYVNGRLTAKPLPG